MIPMTFENDFSGSMFAATKSIPVGMAVIITISSIDFLMLFLPVKITHLFVRGFFYYNVLKLFCCF